MPPSFSPNGKAYGFLFYFAVAAVFFQMISDVTARKIVTLLGLPVSVTVLYFPMTFVLSDILTEVYGYACARRVLWLTLATSVGAGAVYELVAFLPSPPFFENADAYRRVFGLVPRVLFGGWIAVFAGESANNFVMAALKIRTQGRYLWTRMIGSTVVGQGVNTLVFYAIALSGVLPLAALGRAVLAGWLFKIGVEVLCTPLVYRLVGWLKRAEGEDWYDRGTDFNPLRF